MYICICNGIREADLRAAASDGARTAEAAYAAMGIETCCAKCLAYAQEIIDDERRSCVSPG